MTGWTMHFGNLLKSLYERRGFSQRSLAEKARTSEATIHRGVQSAKCPWRRTRATEVLAALESVAPLTKNELENYLQLSGLDAIAKFAAEQAEQSASRRSAAAADVAGSTGAFTTSDSPEETTAHDWVQRLLDEAGATRVLAALEGLAVSWSIDLPPRIRKEDAARRGAWVYHGEVIDYGTHTIQKFAPVERPAIKPAATQSPATARSKAKRRSGA